MVDDLNMSSSKGTVAYFFCRHDIYESLKTRTIIGSLARQFLQQSNNLERISQGSGEDFSTLDFEKISHLLHDTLDKSEAYHIVLDGVDECEDEVQQELLHLLHQLQTIMKLLICISFRTGLNSESTIRAILRPRAILSILDSNPDIGQFIEAELEARLESGKLSIGDPAIILEIQDALEIGAQGM